MGVYTNADKVRQFAQLTFEDVLDETLNYDQQLLNFYTESKPIWADSVTIFFNNNSTASTNYTTDYERGKFTLTAQASSSDTVTSSYTYSDMTSTQIESLITFAEANVSNSTNKVSDANIAELLTNLLTSHLIHKNLASRTASGGANSYSIGYISITKGAGQSNPHTAMSNEYLANYERTLKTLDTTTNLKITRRQTDNTESDRYYYDGKLVDNLQNGSSNVTRTGG